MQDATEVEMLSEGRGSEGGEVEGILTSSHDEGMLER